MSERLKLSVPLSFFCFLFVWPTKHESLRRHIQIASACHREARLGPVLSRSKLFVLTVSVFRFKTDRFAVYRLPFCHFAALTVLPFCRFGFTVLHFAVSIFTGRFVVLPFCLFPFCRFVVPFRCFAVPVLPFWRIPF